LSQTVRFGGRGFQNLTVTGRHRPQRCRQTDQTAGEAAAHVQADSLEEAKGRCSRVTAAFELPVHRKGITPTFPMKFYLIPALGIWAALASAAFSQSTETRQDESARSATTAARIIGTIPDGTPPPPTPPRPQYQIDERDVLATTSHQQGGRTITMRQIIPIDLPSPPTPHAAQPEEVAALKERLAAYRAEHPKAVMLFLGATVFRFENSPPRTLVRYWPKGGGGTITFWSSADFALIAGGITAFADATGQTHHLFMAWGDSDGDHLNELRASRRLGNETPAPPDFPPGKTSFQIIGGAPAPDVLIPIQTLHDLYHSEFGRLKAAYEGRERARIAREEYLKANPPQPKDITLNYWRTEEPAPNEKGEPK